MKRLKVISSYLLVLVFILGFATICIGVELVRQKNVATYVYFPMVDTSGVLAGNDEANFTEEIDAFTDGAVPDGFAACANNATEPTNDSGMYALSLTAGEMNNDYIALKISSSTSGVRTQIILIRTMAGDPLNFATLDDATAAATGINATSGAVDSVTTVGSVTTKTGYNVTSGTVDTATACTSVTNPVTITSNADITGHSLIGSEDHRDEPAGRVGDDPFENR